MEPISFPSMQQNEKKGTDFIDSTESCDSEFEMNLEQFQHDVTTCAETTTTTTITTNTPSLTRVHHHLNGP